MQYLRQSTATAILIGPFIDDADGKSPETGLTVTSMDADLYKHSNTHPLTKGDLTITASGGDNDCAHVANGYYSLELTTGNTDTAGRLLLSVNIAGALPVWHEYTVLPGQAFDSLVLGTDALQVHANEITAGLITAAAIDTGAITSAKFASGAIDAAAIAADAIGSSELAQAAADKVWSTAARALTDKAGFSLASDQSAVTVGTVNAVAAGGITATSFADNAVAAAKVAADACNKIADHTIRRSFQNACDSSNGDTKTFRSLLGAIAKLVNKVAPNGSNIEIMEDDDTTVLGVQVPTTNPAAEPVISIDTN